jgi:hypothetical protein
MFFLTLTQLREKENTNNKQTYKRTTSSIDKVEDAICVFLGAQLLCRRRRRSNGAWTSSTGERTTIKPRGYGIRAPLVSAECFSLAQFAQIVFCFATHNKTRTHCWQLGQRPDRAPPSAQQQQLIWILSHIHYDIHAHLIEKRFKIE